MTTTRPEIIIEGSDDGSTWRAYEFPFKAGDTKRPLRWNIPHQPRVDWQLWFAAFEGEAQNRWIEGLLYQLLRGSPDVLALLGSNPFPEHPPKFVRAQLYDYRFCRSRAACAYGRGLGPPRGWRLRAAGQPC